MTLRLAGSTSGYTEIDCPSVGGNNTLMLPTGNGSSGQVLSTNGSGALSWIGAGKILQVVQATYSTATTIASSTPTDTGLSASITPSSSSNKIVVLIDQPINASRSAASQRVIVKLLRGSTAIYNSADVGDYAANITGATAVEFSFHASIVYLDSPATTSSTTYKTQAAVVSTSSSGTMTAQHSSTMATITLLEVAA